VHKSVHKPQAKGPFSVRERASGLGSGEGFEPSTTASRHDLDARRVASGYAPTPGLTSWSSSPLPSLYRGTDRAVTLPRPPLACCFLNLCACIRGQPRLLGRHRRPVQREDQVKRASHKARFLRAITARRRVIAWDLAGRCGPDAAWPGSARTYPTRFESSSDGKVSRRHPHSVP